MFLARCPLQISNGHALLVQARLEYHNATVSKTSSRTTKHRHAKCVNSVSSLTFQNREPGEV